jgi:hypothetical protein
MKEGEGEVGEIIGTFPLGYRVNRWPPSVGREVGGCRAEQRGGCCSSHPNDIEELTREAAALITHVSVHVGPTDSTSDSACHAKCRLFVYSPTALMNSKTELCYPSSALSLSLSLSLSLCALSPRPPPPYQAKPAAYHRHWMRISAYFDPVKRSINNYSAQPM